MKFYLFYKPRKRVSVTRMFQFVWILFASFSAMAAVPAPNPDSLLPLDALQRTIGVSHRSKKAQSLKNASLAIKNKKFSEAIQFANKLEDDPVYADYGAWLVSSAYLEQAKQFLEHGDFSNALKLAHLSINTTLQIENKSPYSPFLRNIPKDLAQAELIIGDANWGKHHWKQSEIFFERAFQRLQSQNTLVVVKPTHLSHYAEACKKDLGTLCLGWLQKFSIFFIKKSEEMKAISKYFPEVPEAAKAVRSVSKVTIPYKAPDLDLAAFDEAMKSYLNEKYGAASKAFRQFLDDYPRSVFRFRARYWLAQALSREHENKKSQTLLDELLQDSPLTYYGLLASYATGKSIDLALATDLPLASEQDTGLQPKEMIHLRRAQNFVAENAFNLAAYELKDLKARDGLSSPFLAYLAMLNFKSKNYSTGFQVIGELIQRGYEGISSPYGLKMIFPIEFYTEIQKHAKKNDLDPVLVLSLIKQESAFEEDVNSSVGALGLMQLMPTTASETMPQVSAADLLTADNNIAVGTKYLKKLLNRFNGNIVFALAGYNAGPNAVDRWLKDTPAKRGMLEFIESIPYRETREYVSSIIRNYFWYSRQINGVSSKNLDYFWGAKTSTSTPAQTVSPTPEPEPSPTDPKTKPQNGNA